MKQIKINRIAYTNFKGINQFVLELEGQNATVSAANNIGKTSLYDGFYWLLFDKNSQEQAQFRIKPFDKNGVDILGTDTVVEAELTIDGERVLLRKEVLEKWTNPKNSLEKVRGKDVKKYFINGIPAKTKKEYTEFIADIIDEQSFKLLTNPAYFAAKGWDERRNILLDLVDEIQLEDVIAFDSDFEMIREDLEKHSLDDLKESLKYQLKDFQKKEKDISTRIDEVSMSVIPVQDNKESLLQKSEQLKEDYHDLLKQQAEITNGGTVAQLTRQIEAVQSKMHEGRIKFSQTNQLSINNLHNDLNNLNSRYRSETENLYDVNMKLERLVKHIASEKERREILLDQYRSEISMMFDEGSNICSCCGQELPSDKIADMLTHFNTHKSKKLESILAEGTKIKEAILLAEDQMKELKETQKQYSDSVLQLKIRSEKLKKELERLIEVNGSYEDTEEYESLINEGMEIQGKIAEEQDSKQYLLSELQEKINLLAQEQTQINEKVSLINQNELQKKRILELSNQRKEIVDAFNEKQGKLVMADEFFKTKIKLQEEKVNALFEMTKFVFFGVDGSGEEKEMCSITVDGSDYHTNLNNAARINSGLDIINTLSKAYGIAAPIFIDNAEGVNTLFETQSQMISLVVATNPDFKVEIGS